MRRILAYGFFVLFAVPLMAQEPPLLMIKGYLVPAHRSSVSVRVPGQITEVFVQEGDEVRKGDALIRVDPTAYQIDLQKAEGAFQAAEAKSRQLLELGDAVSAPEKAAAKAALIRAQSERDMARYRLDMTVTRAPFDGTILSTSVQVGDAARGDAPVCVLASLQVMEVEVAVPERNLAKVVVGQKCRITPTAYPDVKLEGVVSRIVPMADRMSGTVPVRVRFEAPREPRLFPDLSATVELDRK